MLKEGMLMVKEYKSNTFSLLIQEPKYALQVFNALNGTHYEDESEVEIKMLSNGINLKVRNDASFIFHGLMSLYEHQSTPNPNMPLRFLMYTTRLFEDLVKEQEILGRTLLNLPTPHFVVLYNGREKQPEVQTLRLSDAYEVRQESYELDLACTVYNINKSNNAWLLENCEALNGYMTFVEYVRNTYSGNDAEKMQECLTEATDYCIDNNILPDFFRKYKDQIVEVEMIDYSIEKMEYFAEKRGYDAGVTAGISEKTIQVYKNCLDRGVSKDEAIAISGIREEDISLCSEKNSI